jgi:hypothetical protein
MTHVHVDDLAEHHEGLLDTATTARIDAHLQECAQCSALADDLAENVSSVSTLLRRHAGRPEPIPDLVAGRVRRGLREEASLRNDERGSEPLQVGAASPRRSRWARNLVAAAAVVAVTFGISQVWEDLRPTVTGAADQAASGSGPESSAAADALPRESDDASRHSPTELAPRGRETQAQPPGVAGEESLNEFLQRMEGLQSDVDPPRRYREPCVAKALRDSSWSGYSYRFEREGRPAAVVAVQPSGDLFRVSIIRCDPQPVVQASARLPDPA